MGSEADVLRCKAKILVNHPDDQLFVEPDQIDDDACMSAAADFLGSNHCTYAEFDMATDRTGHFGERDDATAHRSRRKVTHVHARAHRRARDGIPERAGPRSTTARSRRMAWTAEFGQERPTHASGSACRPVPPGPPAPADSGLDATASARRPARASPRIDVPQHAAAVPFPNTRMRATGSPAAAARSSRGPGRG